MTSERPEHDLAPSGHPYMSPSRMEKLETCPRAYAFRYCDRIKPPPKDTAAFGTLVHKALERYFQTRDLPASEIVVIGKHKIDVGQCAIAGLRYLPLPHPSLRIEYPWQAEVMPSGAVIPGERGYWYQGVIDVYDTERESAFEVGEFSDDGAVWSRYDSRHRAIPLIIDHKSTGDFKWIKTADVLRGTDLPRGDPQPGFYGWKAIADFQARYGEAPEWIHFRWVYYLRQEGEARARCTDLRLRPSEIGAIVGAWLDVAEDAFTLHTIKKTREDFSANDILPKMSGCAKFGGCEYGPPKRHSPGNLNICRLSDGERLVAAMTANIPLSQQVAAFMSGGAPQAPSVASPFGAINPPEAQAAFGGAPQAAFGGAPSVAPSVASPFGGAPQAQAAFAAFAAQAAPQAPSVDPRPFPPFVPPASVDPRLAECLPAIPHEQRAAWIAHCETNGLDHRSGQPRAHASPAFVPQAPVAAPVTEVDDATFRGLAQRLYEAGRAPAADTAHPKVITYYNAIVTMYGPPKNAAPIAPASTEPKRRGRPKKKDAAGNDTADDDDSPQIVITVKAIDELIGFLQSLRATAPSA